MTENLRIMKYMLNYKANKKQWIKELNKLCNIKNKLKL